MLQDIYWTQSKQSFERTINKFTFSLLANKLVDRILDELVRPIRKLQLLEAERVALTALILLDAGKLKNVEH